MAAVAAAPEAADSPGDSAGWDWVYDEETAQREKDDSAARAQQAQQHWENTENAASLIKGHLSTLLADPGPLDWEVGSSAGKVRRARISEGSHECQRSLNVVHNKLTRKEDRFARVSTRQSAQVVEDARKKERMEAEQTAATHRCLQKQREIHENQRKRAFNQAQRRSELQKTLREFHREKERVWEDYYEKSREVSNSSTAGISESPRHKAGGDPGAQGAGAEQEDDILSTMTKSHGVYRKQLEQWLQFEAENEKRTDAMWNKILDGKSKEDIFLEAKFRRKAKEVISMNFAGGQARRASIHGTRRTSLAAMAALAVRDAAGGVPGSAPAGPQETKDDALTATLKLFQSRSRKSADSPPDSPSSFSESNASPPTKAQWQDLSVSQRLAAEKKEKECTAALLDAQRRKKDIMEARVKHQKKNNAEWFKRNCDASKRRSDAEVSDEGAWYRKEATLVKKMHAEEARRAELRTSRLLAKSSTIQHVQAQHEADGAQRVQKFKNDFAKAADAASEKNKAFNNLHLNFQERARREVEFLKAAGKHKDTAEEEFKQKARDEISHKAERFSRALHGLNNSTFEREREARKERKAFSPSSAGATEISSVGAASLMMSASAPALVTSAPISPSGRKSGEASEEEEEEEDDGAKAAFLGELGLSCGGWLQELRRQD